MSTRPEHRRRRDPVLLGCLAAVLAPFAVGFVRVAFVHWTPTGDWALLELRTRSVGGPHTPIVGAYSRFGWSHPGPALFYALALPYRLFASRPAGLLAAALLVNAASVAGIVLLAWRRGRRPLTIGTAIALAVVCRALGAELLRDPWNPIITVLPFALLIFLAWSIACGDLWMLPIAVLVASFVVQSHVGYAVLVAVALVVAIAWRLVDFMLHRGDETFDRSRRRTGAIIGASVVAGVAAWLPPLIDQHVNPGNLNAIFEFFGRPHRTPTNDTAFRLVGRALALPGTWITGHEGVRTSDFTASTAGFFFPFALVAVLAAVLVALRRRDRDALALLVIVLATMGAAVYSISHVAGPLAAYLVHWLLVLGMVSWLAAAWAFWPWLRRLVLGRAARRALGVAVIAALVVPVAMSIADSVRARAPWYRVGRVEQQLARETIANLHSGGRPVVLKSTREHFFTWGLAPRLEAAGIPVASRQSDVLYYGRHRVSRWHEARVAVVVVLGRDARTTGRPAGGRLLAFYPGVDVPVPALPATANYNDVVRFAEPSLLRETVAVYEVPL
jgi:hypothetical protein